MSRDSALQFRVYGHIVATTPLYQAVCDHCPLWLGPVTDCLDRHVQDVRSHAAQHPVPPARWISGMAAPRRATRGVEVGRVPVWRVICDECPRYVGVGGTDREQVLCNIALHVAVHEAHRRLVTEGTIEARRAHQAAVEADPGHWPYC